MNQYLVTAYDYTDDGALKRRMDVRVFTKQNWNSARISEMDPVERGRYDSGQFLTK